MRYFIVLAYLVFVPNAFAANDGESHNPSQRVRPIASMLSRFSGKSFPVFVRECKGWAEAREDRTIVIDLNIAKKERTEIVAFLLAHEWGHLVRSSERGKAPGEKKIGPAMNNQINPSVVGAAIASREEEREADRFAVRFMVKAGYDVGPYVTFLLEAPDDQRLYYGLHTHDTREVRSKFIRELYTDLTAKKRKEG